MGRSSQSTVSLDLIAANIRYKTDTTMQIIIDQLLTNSERFFFVNELRIDNYLLHLKINADKKNTSTDKTLDLTYGCIWILKADKNLHCT